MTDLSCLIFLGVTTRASFVPRVMPAWADALDVAFELKGVDLPIGVEPGAYRSLLDRVRPDQWNAGIVVTTHKAALWDACNELFDDATPLARMLREATVVARGGEHGERLIADASDVRGVGRAVTRLLADARWTDGAREALIMGAGGAGLSLAYNLADRLPDLGATRIVLTEADPARVAAVRTIVNTWERASSVGVTLAESDTNDGLVGSAKPGTLIVNATGMGKDRPGSPIGVDPPRRSIVWDFNYRGERPLLVRARTRERGDDLLVADGRDYLICGWLEALCSVFDQPATPELLEQFERAASAAGI